MGAPCHHVDSSTRFLTPDDVMVRDATAQHVILSEGPWAAL